MMKKLLCVLTALLLFCLPCLTFAEEAAFKTLVKGSKGSEVRTLKRFLASKGYAMPIPDVYNETIRDAVRAWQASAGKTVTGTITEAQYNAIVAGKE